MWKQLHFQKYQIFWYFPNVLIRHVSSSYCGFLGSGLPMFLRTIVCRVMRDPDMKTERGEERGDQNTALWLWFSVYLAVCKPELLEYFLGCVYWGVFLGSLTRMSLFYSWWSMSTLHSLARWEWTLYLFSLSPWNGERVRSLANTFLQGDFHAAFLSVGRKNKLRLFEGKNIGMEIRPFLDKEVRGVDQVRHQDET